MAVVQNDRIAAGMQPAEDGGWSVDLGNGQFAYIDECDVPVVAKYRWRAAQRYAAVRGIKGAVLMHRLILEPPAGIFVDHIDGDGRNNRRSNLRLCTHAENQRNRRKVQGSVPFKGVGRDRKKFTASISINGAWVRLGRFDSAVEAALAYDEAALRHHGEFAATNRSLGLL